MKQRKEAARNDRNVNFTVINRKTSTTSWKWQPESLWTFVEVQLAKRRQKGKLVIILFYIWYLNRNTCNSWDNTASHCASGLMTLPKTIIIIQTGCVAMLAMSPFSPKSLEASGFYFSRALLLKPVKSNKTVTLEFQMFHFFLHLKMTHLK